MYSLDDLDKENKRLLELFSKMTNDELDKHLAKLVKEGVTQEKQLEFFRLKDTISSRKLEDSSGLEVLAVNQMREFIKNNEKKVRKQTDSKINLKKILKIKSFETNKSFDDNEYTITLCMDVANTNKDSYDDLYFIVNFNEKKEITDYRFQWL